MSRTIKAFIGIAAALAFAACGGSGKPAARGGALLSVNTAALSQNVQEVSVDIADAGGAFATTVFLTKAANGTFVAQVGGLPLDTLLTFSAQASDPLGTATYIGQATTTISSLGTPPFAVVSIALQEMTPPAFQNNAPRITSITSNARFVAPGGAVSVSVTATDADGDALIYSWSSVPNTTGFADAAAASTVWTAPLVTTPTDYALTVVVSDGKNAQTMGTLLVTVSTASTLDNVGVSAILNDAPVIARIDVNPVPDAAAAAGAALATQVTVFASDVDGPAPMTYLWAIDTTFGAPNPATGCAGFFLETNTDTATIPNPTFVPAMATGDFNTCALTVTVTDALGAANTGSVSFATLLAAASSTPHLYSSFQSATSVVAGGTAWVRALFANGYDATVTPPVPTLLSTVYAGAGVSITNPNILDPDLALVQFPDATAMGCPVAPATVTVTANPFDPNLLDPNTGVPGVVNTDVFRNFTFTVVCP